MSNPHRNVSFTNRRVEDYLPSLWKLSWLACTDPVFEEAHLKCTNTESRVFLYRYNIIMILYDITLDPHLEQKASFRHL